MKKAIVFLLGLFATALAGAQTIDNAGMEDWRSTTVISLTSPPAFVSLQTPKMWFCTDSLALAVGPAVAGTSGAPFNRQSFKEATLKHSGSFSARVMTALQGDLGFFPGILTNAKIIVDPGASAPEEAITFEGGQAVTVQPNTVSAWVVYKPGIDTTTDTIGYDEGLMTVMAIATIGAIDSTVGVGFVTITPSDTDTFSEVTATLSYTTTDYPVHTLRIMFASSGDPSTALDSSTLYVDDLSMTGSPNPPPPVSVGTVGSARSLSVFPNPANNEVTVTGAEGRGLTISLLSGTGSVVMSMPLKGNDRLDLHSFAAGLYLYTISDSSGNTVADGKLSVVH